MKIFIIFLTLFICGQVYSDPPHCCRVNQYTIRYNETALDDPDYAHLDIVVTRDYARNRTLRTVNFNLTRSVYDYNQRLIYMMLRETCESINMPPESAMSTHSCIDGNLVFVREYFEGDQRLHVWNRNSRSTGNITVTVNADTCLLVRHEIRLRRHAPRPHHRIIHVFESSGEILYPELFEVPSNCLNP